MRAELRSVRDQNDVLARQVAVAEIEGSGTLAAQPSAPGITWGASRLKVQLVTSCNTVIFVVTEVEGTIALASQAVYIPTLHSIHDSNAEHQVVQIKLRRMDF